MNKFFNPTLNTSNLTQSVALIAFAIGGALVPLESAYASQTVPSDGLIGYWAGDGNANDSSLTGNNGSFSGSYVAGVNGQAFDLSTAKVLIPDNPAYSFGSAFSVGFWFNVNGASTNSIVFVGQDNGVGSLNKWFIDYNYGNPSKFEFHLNKPGIPHGEFLPSDSVALSNEWNQLTLVKNNSSYSFFLNGNNIGNDTSTVFGGTIPDPTFALIFGRAEGGFNFNGLMNNVVLYNRALTELEVQGLATASPVPIAATIWLFGSALTGLVGFSRRMYF